MAIVGGYHHVHIICPDPEGAVKWFGQFLGAKVILREDPRGAKNVVMKIGEAILSVRTPRPTDKLIETDGSKPLGLDHICFLVDDLTNMVDHMRENGVEIAEEIFDHSGGSEAAFILGPENVLFELIQAK